jgi:hypothetical protein
MYAFNADILKSIKTPSDSASAPLGYKMWVGSHSLGLVLGDGSKNEFALEFVYGRFAEAFLVTGGIPAYAVYDATYGYFCFTDTYVAGYGLKGITPTYTVAPTAGQYGWIQCGGLNGWALTTSEAAAVNAVLTPVSAATTVESADSDAERMLGIGVLLGPALGAGGATGVGSVMIGGCFTSS